MDTSPSDRPVPAGKTLLLQCALVAGFFLALEAIYALAAGQIDYQGAALIQHIPLKDALIDQWRGGAFPTWTSLVGAGQPIYADAATLPLDPRNLFLLPFGTVDGYIAASIATRALAATIMFSYLRRRLGASAWASLLGALVFLSGTSLLEEGSAFSSGVLMLPAFVWLSERLYERLTVGTMLSLAGAWALFIVTNSAAYAPYFVIACVTWCVLLGWFESGRFDRASVLRFLAAFGAAGVVGLGLSAFVVLPTLELGSLSNRGNEYRSDPYALSSLFALFFGANDTAAENFPFLGSGFFYIGVISFVPILVALRHWASPYVRAGLTLALGTVAVLLIGFLFKPTLIDVFPSLASVPVFRPALVLGFAAAVLVTIGLDRPDWSLAARERLVVGALFLLQAAVLVGAVVIATPFLAVPLLLVAVRAIGLGVALLAPSSDPLRLGSLNAKRAALVGGLLAVELAIAWGIARPMTGVPYRSLPEVSYLQDATGSDLRAMEVLPRPEWPAPLPAATDSTSLVENAPAYHGIPIANVYAGLIPEDYSDTFKDFGDFDYREQLFVRAPNAYMTTSAYDSPLLRALGVGYLYSSSMFPAPTLSKPALTGDGYYVYALRDPLPRAYFAGRARWLPREAVHGELRRLATRRPGAIELGPEILLEGDERSEGRPAFAPASVVEDDGSSVEVSVDAPSDGFLVLSDIDLPGWSADVDGEQAEIEQANGFARAVRVTRGAHTVRFDYTPARFATGALISAVTALLCLLALSAELLRRRRSPRRSRSRTSRSRAEAAPGERSSGR